MIIGLTGGSGVGKGTVASILKNDGFYHIDADVIADDILNGCDECKKEIFKEFPDCEDNGNINRKILSSIVFSDESKLLKLNDITHKYIMNKIKEIIKSENQSGTNDIILDAAAIYESGADKICDYVIAVASDRKNRVERIISRDMLTKEEAETRISGQHEDEFFSQRADYIIYNNGDFDELYSNVESILFNIRNIKE